MTRLIRLLAGVLLACLLGACASPVPVDITPAALSKIHTVTVIRPPVRKVYTVLNLGHPGMAFGLIGGIIAATDMQNKQTQLAKALEQEKITVNETLADGLAAQLTRAGFQAAAADGPWEEKDGRFTMPYAKIESNADAVIVIVPTIVGFVATAFGGDYQPTITSVVTLLDKEHKTPLYRGYHATGWKPRHDAWRYVPGTTVFPNFTDLMQSPSATATSLNEAAERIAQSVGNDLKGEGGSSAAPAATATPPAAASK